MIADLIPTPQLVARINGERMHPMAVYRDEGCESRFEWLQHLAEFNGVPLRDVIAMADVLTAEEDFDGLVSSVEDVASCLAADGGWEE